MPLRTFAGRDRVLAAGLMSSHTDTGSEAVKGRITLWGNLFHFHETGHE